MDIALGGDGKCGAKYWKLRKANFLKTLSSSDLDLLVAAAAMDYVLYLIFRHGEMQTYLRLACPWNAKTDIVWLLSLIGREQVHKTKAGDE